MTQASEMRAGIDACVHCGFCLPACPTYLALEDENDSPRGRIVLMNALLEGTLAPTEAAVGTHLDQCLGCRGCETACPSGVPYGMLLEATRERMVEVRPLPWIARAVLFVFANEWLLRPALAIARLVRALGLARIALNVLPVRLAMPAAMLDATARPASERERAVVVKPSADPMAPRAALLTGCVMEGLMAPINRATERQLAVHGQRVVSVPGQVCCGALHAHAGDADTARELAKTNIAAFEASGADTIVMNSAGCGAMCREYGHLLANDRAWAARARAFSAKVRDVHEIIAPTMPALDDAGSPSSAKKKVAWDAPCHLEHAQRVAAPPIVVLNATPGITLVPLAGSDQCCGSAGIFSLTQPGVSQQVLAPKLRAIAESGADIVATANPGCLMQIAGGLALAGSHVQVRHSIELVDAEHPPAPRTH
jgi:glycolate oxidase iron-sulfur subunit